MKYKLVKIKDGDGTIYFKMVNNKGLSTDFFEDIKKTISYNKLSEEYGEIFDTDTILYEIEFNEFDDLLELVPEEFL